MGEAPKLGEGGFTDGVVVYEGEEGAVPRRIEGRNELHLNEATLILALQQWLSSWLIGDIPMVKNVRQQASPGGGHVFVVQLEAKPDAIEEDVDGDIGRE